MQDCRIILSEMENFLESKYILSLAIGSHHVVWCVTKDNSNSCALLEMSGDYLTNIS